MNLSEFRAWFEGFTEEMDGPPSTKQWKRIKKRVSEIIDAPTTYPVFIDRYVRPYPWYWQGGGRTYISASSQTDKQSEWSSSSAFTALGRADANQITAE